MHELTAKIDLKQARVAVIGLGYVGLPVAVEFARAGFDVLGVEIRAERADCINHGQCPIEGEEPGLSEALAEAVAAGRLTATAGYAGLDGCDVVLIDVETPVDEHHVPRYEALRSALKSLGPHLKPGALVIVESTIAPGTMTNLVRPQLEKASGKVAGKDFYLGHCPERVMPGKLLANLRTVSRVVGGDSADTAEAMRALYRCVVSADLDPADLITAELTKTVENAYRDVQIAFANEVALICEAVNGDVWKVRELVNKSPGRSMHLPGAGVGGHCITKDPWLLAFGVSGMHVPLRVIPAARQVNDEMPIHMLDLLADALRAAGVALSDSRILIMGFAYLEDSDDTRNSPSEVLANHLQGMGVEVRIHDPYVPAYQGDLLVAAQGCDAAVVMVRHKPYRALRLDALRKAMRTGILVDGRRVYSAEQAHEAGFAYKCVGVESRQGE